MDKGIQVSLLVKRDICKRQGGCGVLGLDMALKGRRRSGRMRACGKGAVESPIGGTFNGDSPIMVLKGAVSK